MPRHADPDARREQLASAALDIALTQGLDRVSVPRIAQRAGVSVGLVQHYFPAKAALVVTAYEALAARVDARVGAIVEAGEAQRGSIREMVAAGLGELLPLDAERRAEGMVRAEFAARALREQSLGAVARSLRSTLLARVTLAIENGQECGETASALGAAAAAGAALELVALSEGLAAALLVEPDATDVARLAPDDAADAAPAASVEVLRGACARVFPGACARAEVTAVANRLDQASGQ